MPLQRPRRIFRSSPLARPSPAMLRAAIVAVAGLAGLGLLGAAALAIAGLSTDLFGRTPPPTGRVLTAEPAQVAVIDGGTLRLDRQVVRLLGVDPPPRGESCGGTADCGSAAANALAVLVRRKPISCELHGRDDMGRPLGACVAAGTDLNRAVVATGWARAGTEREDLREAESSARAQRIGLWATTER
ncbi:MAG TPA: thermonuclease family protein [Acetobacteraceae bacterium]|nr:thermonuclease family protein [Acetobacteraceae bacterium]